MQKTITLNTNKIERQIANIDNIASKENWRFFYDSELDSLYLSPEIILPKYSLYALNDEFSIYVDKKSNVGGIFVEYYKRNLTKHNDKFKEFKNMFKDNQDRDNKDQEIKGKKALLSEILKAELLSQLVQSEASTITIPA